MDRRQLDTLFPGLYAIAIVASLFLFGGAVFVFVAVIGAMLLGLYYSVRNAGGHAPEGRQRHRNRQR